MPPCSWPPNTPCRSRRRNSCPFLNRMSLSFATQRERSAPRKPLPEQCPARLGLAVARRHVLEAEPPVQPHRGVSLQPADDQHHRAGAARLLLGEADKRCPDALTPPPRRDGDLLHDVVRGEQVGRGLQPQHPRDLPAPDGDPPP